MTRTGAELFVDALAEYGVERVFGNPGTTELPVMNALAETDDLEYVLGVHEDVAVGAAAGYAQTRRYHSHHDPSVTPLGVVNLHVAPGLAHGLGNIYDAAAAGAPLVVTAGNHELDFRHEEPLLHGDLEAMTDQFCKWADEVLDVGALPTMLRRAVRTALTPPTGPVFLGLPVDVMMAETDADPERLGAIPDAGRGDPDQVAAAADALVEADDPVLVVGDYVARSGAVGAAVDLAEAGGARVHGELLSSEVNFPDDHEQWVSRIPAAEAGVRPLLEADTLVFAGCESNTTLLRHEEPLVPEAATVVQFGPDARAVGKNVPADAGVVGDPGHVMTAVAERVADRLPEAERERRVAAVEAFDVDSPGPPTETDDPRASKGELAAAMRAAAPDAFVVSEAVTSTGAFRERFPFDAESHVSNAGGGLGYGLPAAVGAAIAESMRETPRDVVGFVADGSYLYYPHSVYTAVRQGVDLTVVVPDNRNYRILKDNTARMLGGEVEDYDYVGMDFEPAVDIPANAESHGATGRLVDDPAAIADAIRAAVDAPGVDVLDVLVHD